MSQLKQTSNTQSLGLMHAQDIMPRQPITIEPEVSITDARKTYSFRK